MLHIERRYQSPGTANRLADRRPCARRGVPASSSTDPPALLVALTVVWPSRRAAGVSLGVASWSSGDHRMNEVCEYGCRYICAFLGLDTW
jgi:hypothetical protein